MQNVTPDTWHVTCDTRWVFVCLWGIFCIGATLRSRREILCLLYAGYFSCYTKFIAKENISKLWWEHRLSSTSKNSVCLHIFGSYDVISKRTETQQWLILVEEGRCLPSPHSTWVGSLGNLKQTDLTFVSCRFHSCCRQCFHGEYIRHLILDKSTASCYALSTIN